MQTIWQDNASCCGHSSQRHLNIILCSSLPLMLTAQHQTKIKIVSLILANVFFVQVIGLCYRQKKNHFEGSERFRRVLTKVKQIIRAKNKFFYVCYIILMLQMEKSWATVSLCFSKRVIVISMIKMSGTIRQTASLQCYCSHCVQSLPVKAKVSK